MSTDMNHSNTQIQSTNPTKHEKNSNDHLLSPFTSDDFDARDELRERELEEARARASQMEKTMRWWSDCTANWREKWGKVRAERNKAREENRQLRLKLEAAAKEISNLRREKLAAGEAQSRLEKEVEKLERELRKDKRSIPSARVEPSPKEDSTDYVDSGLNNSSVYEKTVPKLGAEKLFIEQILQKNELYDARRDDGNSFERSHSVPADDRKKSRSGSVGSRKKKLSQEESLLEIESSQKLSLMRMKLEETEKLLAEERSAKQNLLEELDNLQADLTDLKFKNEEIKMSYKDSSVELTRIRDKYEREVEELNADLEEAYNTNNSTGNVKKISDLRGEIERLQSENSMEWSKREKLESDKLTLERENKKLKIQIEDLSAQLRDSSKSLKATTTADIKQLQTQLEEKNREQQELKYAYNKVRKQLQEKAEELSHSRKRLEQHENEVRKLRTRVEELKVDLSKAEDELDSQTSTMRKLQRNLDEQTECADSYKVQLKHLNSRLRLGAGALPTRNTRFKSGRQSSLQLSSDESDGETSLDEKLP